MLIAYTHENKLSLVTHIEDSGVSIETLATMVVPQGAPYAFIDRSSLPQDEAYAEAWVLDVAAQAVVVDPALKVGVDKKIAMRDLDAWFADQIAAGFATADGWKLGLTPNDVTLLTGNFVLSKEAAAMGGPIPPVIDKDGVPHEVADIEELTAIMLGYGQHRAQLSAEYAARKAEILGG